MEEVHYGGEGSHWTVVPKKNKKSSIPVGFFSTRELFHGWHVHFPLSMFGPELSLEEDPVLC